VDEPVVAYTKPEQPDTDTSFNTPDIQRDGSSSVYTSFTAILVWSVYCILL